MRLLTPPRQAVPIGERRSARGGGAVAGMTVALVIGAIALSGLWQRFSLPEPLAAAPALEASAPSSVLPEIEDSDDMVLRIVNDVGSAVAAAGARVNPGDPPGYLRIPKPKTTPSPRRVGIQAGHWLTIEAPRELGRVLTQTGTSWAGVTEWETNLDIAERVALLLRAKGLVVDVLPTTIPPGYLADAFVALHADGDGVGAKSGFKLAHSQRRTPHEDLLQQLLTEEFGAATQLRVDTEGISGNMRGYYAHSWSRIRYSTSPFTPSVILEMGFLSHPRDRHLLLNEPDLLAGAIAQGILRFLDARPSESLFGQDLVVPPLRFRTPAPPPGATPP